MDLYYYSFTGICEDIASEIGQSMGILPKPIKSYKFSYWTWLFLSFFPGLSVKIDYPEPESREGILIFPKWTFNCPPITAFLKGVRFERLFLIISYGGWGEKPYANRYKNLALKNSTKVELYLVKRSLWQCDRMGQLAEIKNRISTFFNLTPFQNIHPLSNSLLKG